MLDAYIDANEVDSDKNSDPDKIGPGRSLAEFVMAKVAEGTKKGSFSGGGVSLQSFDLSDNFVSTIPVSLQRKCIAQRLESCRKCCLKGYVMDVWGTGASIATPATFISSVEDFVELLPASVSQQLTQRSMDPGSLSEIKSLDMTILEFQVCFYEFLTTLET